MERRKAIAALAAAMAIALVLGTGRASPIIGRSVAAPAKLTGIWELRERGRPPALLRQTRFEGVSEHRQEYAGDVFTPSIAC